MPIFHDGELVAWALAGTHQTEAGGIDPGGFCLNATTRYSEGIKMPPIKIGENFVIRDDMIEMMMPQNVLSGLWPRKRSIVAVTTSPAVRM